MKKRKFNPTNAVIAFFIILFFGLIVFSVYKSRSSRQQNGTQGGIPASVQRPSPPDAAGGGSGPAAGANAREGNAPQSRGGAPSNGGAREERARNERGANAAGADTRAGNAPRPSGSGNQGMRNVPAVRVTPVEFGNISNSIIINGDVLAVREVSIFPVTAGKIVELRLRIGDAVTEEQIVAVVDPSRPGEVYSGSPVRSTISGTVLQAPYSAGDTVSQQSAIYVIGDLSSLVVETFVPERFSANIRMGLRAQFFFDSMPDEVFTGIVSEVSPVLDPSSRTLRVRLRFEKKDPRIRPGMFATVSLVTASRSNVPLIPRAAVINTYNSWIVFVVNAESIAERRELSLGLESETMIEVLSGLSIGDIVVSSGQNFLSNNEPVRVLE
ncbi:MAG: efflux RND transporter periplasmic adaptor subunit [Spirochaetaceae bacterium]|nr:efflux RND transporter periplasmic adaptor subunit [Spirochaetaceae bacterium]